MRERTRYERERVREREGERERERERERKGENVPIMPRSMAGNFLMQTNIGDKGQ